MSGERRAGTLTGIADNRLVAYRSNCARIPSITADVVPEPIGSIGEYRERLLEFIDHKSQTSAI